MNDLSKTEIKATLCYAAFVAAMICVVPLWETKAGFAACGIAGLLALLFGINAFWVAVPLWIFGAVSLIIY